MMMATRIIPTRGDIGAYFFQVELDKKVFGLAFQFNAREGNWYFDLQDALGNRIRSGVKVVSGFPFLQRVTNLNRPPGEVIAIDTTGNDLDPDLADLGSKVLLAYEEEVSLP